MALPATGPAEGVDMDDRRGMPMALAGCAVLLLASFAAAAEDATALEEIVVTAQKRVESLQDVPMAVSAIGGAKIASAGILRVEYLKNYVPTLFMTETAIGNNLAIRGIFSGVNPGFEQSVGTYVDGVYRGRSQQARSPFLDLERVEVLRGPQSILFGKNSVAGALNVTSARPGEGFEAMVSALYEPRYDERELTGFVSGPLSERLRGRLAASRRESGGYVTNATLGSDEPAREESTARAWLELDLTDRVRAALKAEVGEFDVTGRQIEITDEEPSLAGPFAGLTYGQILAAFGQDASVLDNAANGMRSANGDFSDNDMEEFVLQVDWEIGDGTLTSITAYSAYDFDELCDCDFTGGNVFNVTLAEDFDQLSQELRLTSPVGGALEYILGAYYETSDLTYRDTILLPGDSVLVPLLNANPAFNGTPLQGIAGTAVADTGTPRLFRQDTASYSLFAQLGWNATEELRTSFGIRYTQDDKDAERRLAITEIDGDPLAGLQAAAAPLVYAAAFNIRRTDLHDLSGSRQEDEVLPSVTFEWAPDEATMLYMGWSRGAKAGGFDARSNNPTVPPGAACTAPNVPAGCLPANGIGTFEFEEEEATTLEFGAKLRLGNVFEMNTALYLTDYEDLQVSSFDGVLGFNVRNAGEAEIKGLEIDWRWQATRNLRLYGSLAYTDFEFLDYIGQCAFGQAPDAADGINCDYQGKTNEFVAPWVTALGAGYARPVGSRLVFHADVDAYHTDAYFVAPTLDDRQRQPAYAKVNGRVGVGGADGGWDISVVGKNVFNEQVLPYGNETPLAGRTFGAFSAWRFVEPGATWALQGTLRF
jgi:iron complex outermembrane recepter protein